VQRRSSVPSVRLWMPVLTDGSGHQASAPSSGGTLYERAGAMPWFEAVADRFYAGVVNDPVLMPMYPTDLDGARSHLALFLAQYWGGPATYSEQRGHPRLRMRHANFPIDQSVRDAWYHHMAAAVVSGGLDEADEAAMLGYLASAADHLRNQQ
jgi:hemoglobin